jgi:DNA-binding NarL/FixJ family response regulator
MEIFLVEDSPLLRTRLAEMLGAIPGASVIGEAERADLAIRDILAMRPDVVVLDLSLAGGTSGFEVLRAVCREAPEIDIYMVSNFVAAPYRELAERLGARDFFDKTTELERVRQVITERAVATTH